MKYFISLLSSFIGFLVMVGVVAFMAFLADPEKACSAILSAPEYVRDVYPCLLVLCIVVFLLLCVVDYFRER